MDEKTSPILHLDFIHTFIYSWWFFADLSRGEGMEFIVLVNPFLVIG
jgi:hypothetical protein